MFADVVNNGIQQLFLSFTADSFHKAVTYAEEVEGWR